MQIIVILIMAGLFRRLFRRIHQPPVMGEMIAGIVLGPSVLGLIYPQATRVPLSRIVTGNTATVESDRRRALYVHRRHGSERANATRKRIGSGDDQSREHHRSFSARHCAFTFSLPRTGPRRNLFPCICVIHRGCDEHHRLSGAGPDFGRPRANANHARIDCHHLCRRRRCHCLVHPGPRDSACEISGNRVIRDYRRLNTGFCGSDGSC